jgi:putative glutamine amidotransferase
VGGLVLSGGGDIAATLYGAEPNELIAMVDPERDRSELVLTQAALQAGTPLLAICRGIQMLNVVRGGTLYADIPTQIPDALPHRPPQGEGYDGAAHSISIAPGSRLAAILGATSVTVNSLHHQAVRQVGQGLLVVARAPDGIVEGLELTDHPFCVGVQFHPELDTAGVGGPLFAALVQAANGNRQAAA